MVIEPERLAERVETHSVAPNGTSYPMLNSNEIDEHFVFLSKQAQTWQQTGKKVVVVQGLGFVGAAVAAVIAGAKDDGGQPLYFVIGVDLHSPESYWKVAEINAGRSPIASPDPDVAILIREGVEDIQNLCATVSEKALALADVIIVDIPLDVHSRFTKDPDEITIGLKTFQSAICTIGRHMAPEALVIIETTVPIGATEKVALPLLQELRAERGIDAQLYLAHAYERVMPGPNYVRSIKNYWRTFSAIDTASAQKARAFLESFIQTNDYPLTELNDPAASELAKLLENSYRAVNIAFIHEWTLLAEQIGVNLFEITDSIRVRKGTHDNMRLPGFGVGGYCLTKDSFLAQWSAAQLYESDVVLHMTLDGIQINNRMPLHTFDLLLSLMDGNLTNKNIVVCGVSYLPEMADTRNSPAEALVDALLQAGAKPIIHDPYVQKWVERPKITVHQNLSVCLQQADGVVFAVPHPQYRELSAQALLNSFTSSSKKSTSMPVAVVDSQNILSDETAESLHEAGCRLLGVGKGHWRKKGYQCQQ